MTPIPTVEPTRSGRLRHAAHIYFERLLLTLAQEPDTTPALNNMMEFSARRSHTRIFPKVVTHPMSMEG
jgi:hypothetical protein